MGTSIVDTAKGVNPLPASGTWSVVPSWVHDTLDGGFPFYRAVSVATGETVEENDDLADLIRAMDAQHPHLALIPNSCCTDEQAALLRSVPARGRV